MFELPAIRSFGVAALAVLLFGGCAAHDGAAFSPPGGTAPQRAARAVVSIHVPKHPKRVRIRVVRNGRPQYVSMATAGMTLTVTGPTNVHETVGLTPSSPGCTQVPAGLNCSIELALKPCGTSAKCYAATVETYDAVSCSGVPPVCTIPTGAHALSIAQDVAFGIRTGGNNSVGLTLSGIPASIIVTPTTVFSRYDDAGNLRLVGLGPHPLLVEALDAGSNIIVGPGAPSFSAAQNGALALAIATPPPASPNRFILTPPAAYSTGTSSVTFTASFPNGTTNGCPPEQLQASCTASVSVTMSQMLAVVNNAGGCCAPYGTVSFFALGDSQPMVSVENDLNDPTTIAADASGDVFVGQRGGKSVLEYDAGGATVTGGAYGVTSSVTALAVDPSGNLYVAQGPQTPEVFEFAPRTLALTRTLAGDNGATPPIGVTNPVSLATDANGRLYVLNAASPSPSTLAEYDPLQTSGSDPLSASATGFTSATAVAVAAGATPQSFVADPAAPGLWRFPYGTASSNGDVTAPGVVPSAVAVDPAGNVYAANVSGNSVTAFAPGGTWDGSTSALATYTSGIDAPAALAFDASGDLIAANAGASTVEIFPAGTTTPSLTLGASAGIATPVALVVVP